MGSHESIRETHCAKTSPWRLIWARSVKTVPGSNTFHHPHTYLSWCLHASASSFLKILLLPVRGMQGRGGMWVLRSGQSAHGNACMETCLPHPPIFSTQPKDYSFNRTFPFTLAICIIRSVEFLWHYPFYLSLGLSNVALEYYFTILI